MSCNTLDEMIDAIKTKRYPESRIRRIIYNLVVGYNNEIFDSIRANDYTPYIHILASNKNGFKKIKQLKADENLLVINNLSELNNKSLTFEQSKMKDLEVKSTEFFNSFISEKHRKHEFTLSPIIID